MRIHENSIREQCEHCQIICSNKRLNIQANMKEIAILVLTNSYLYSICDNKHMFIA